MVITIIHMLLSEILRDIKIPCCMEERESLELRELIMRISSWIILSMMPQANEKQIITTSRRVS